MDDDEIWKPVEGFPGYEVSNLGRVRSWKRRNGRGLSPTPRVLDHGRVKGYPKVCLQRKPLPQVTFSVHQLVLRAFVGPPPPGMIARHFPDPTRHNVRLDNLQWGTYLENNHDRFTHGTATRAVPRHSPGRKYGPLSEETREKIRASLLGKMRGEKNPHLRISAATARAILRAIARGVGPAAIVRKFADRGATLNIVESIKYGGGWKHLPRPWGPEGPPPVPYASFKGRPRA